jgi:predicted O-methyltransferase YrrM
MKDATINLDYRSFPRVLDPRIHYFSNNWFQMNRPAFTQFSRQLTRKEKIRRILEIGSFEGRSSLFWLEEYPRAHITCIDPFLNDGTDHVERKNDACKKIFLHNTHHYRNRVTLLEGKSTDLLPKLWEAGKKYDLIYIDGSHLSNVVLSDLYYAGLMARKGGYILLDDYMHYNHEYPSLRHLSPGVAINTYFRITYPHCFRPVYVAYSIGFEKTEEVPHEKRRMEATMKRFDEATNQEVSWLTKWKAMDEKANKRFWGK